MNQDKCYCEEGGIARVCKFYSDTEPPKPKDATKQCAHNHDKTGGVCTWYFNGAICKYDRRLAERRKGDRRT